MKVCFGRQQSLPALMLAVVITLCACGTQTVRSGGTGSTLMPGAAQVFSEELEEGQVIISVRPQQPVALPAQLKAVSSTLDKTLAELARLPLPRAASAFTEQSLVRNGGGYEAGQPRQRVQSAGTNAVFDNLLDAQSISDFAYATYAFQLGGYPATGRPQSAKFTWNIHPPTGSFYVGLSNFGNDRWDWYLGPSVGDNVLTVASLAPYLHPTTEQLFMLLICFDCEATDLEQIRIGVNEVRGTGLQRPINLGALDNTAPPCLSDSLVSKFELPASWFPPIGDQGSLNSCTGWSAGYSAHTYELRKIYGPAWRSSHRSFQVSALWSYANTPNGCTAYRNMGTVLDYMRDSGNATVGNEGSPDICANSWPNLAGMQADAAALMLDSWKLMLVKGEGGIQAMKCVMQMMQRPVVVGLDIDKAFTDYASGVWEYGLGSPPSPQVGSHAITLVGWDDALQAFRIRNSWGSDWGEDGYGWIAYANFMKPSLVANGYYIKDQWSQAVYDRFLGAGAKLLPPPTNLSANDGLHSDRIELSWDAAPGAVGYRVYRDNPNQPVAILGASTSYSDHGLTPDEKVSHIYWVQSFDGSQRSTRSTEDTGYLQGSDRPAPRIHGVHFDGNLRGGQDVTAYCEVEGDTSGMTYSWDFASAASPGSSSAEHPLINLDNPGSHNCSVTASNADGSDTYNFVLSYTDVGQLPQASLMLNPSAYAHPGDLVVFDAAASQAFQGKSVLLYDWDFDGDGSYEYVTDEPLVYHTFDSTGPRSIRLAVLDSGGALSQPVEVILPVVNPGWTNYQLDPTNDSGSYIQVIRLADGRLGAAWGHPGGMRWAVSRNTAPSSAAEWQLVDLPFPAGQISIGHDLALIGGKPALAVNAWGDYSLYYIYSNTADGADPADWTELLVDTDAGTGIAEGIALDEVAGRPAIAYIGELPNGATPAPDDTCICMAFRRAADSTGSAWGPLVDVDSQNITPALTYHGTNCDMEVIAGYPALIYHRSGLSAQPGVTQVVYAWNDQQDGGGTWNRDLVIDGDIGSDMGCLIDCGGVPGWVAGRSTSGSDDVTFVYGAGSSNAGPGSPWQFTTVVPFNVNNAHQAFSARYYGGKPWFLASNYNSNDLELYSAADGAGSAPWTKEVALNYTAMAASELVLGGGQPCAGYVYIGFNVNARFAIKYD